MRDLAKTPVFWGPRKETRRALDYFAVAKDFPPGKDAGKDGVECVVEFSQKEPKLR
jgi:hypothetical protein